MKVSRRVVTVVQLTLRDTGAQLAIDGSFGPDTRSKLKGFQQANRLPVSGTVDAATWHALMKAPVGKPKPPTTPAPSQQQIVLIDQLKTGPNGHDNCGPTSAVMATIAAGKKPTGYQESLSEASKRSMVIAMQQRMGMTQGNGVGVSGIQQGVRASGASASQTNVDEALAAVRSGRPVLLRSHPQPGMDERQQGRGALDRRG